MTYQLSQSGTASGQVDAGGVATLSNASLAITLISGSVGFPVVFGSTCVFTPINIVLAGTGSSVGLDVSNQGFTIPPTADSCNGWSSLINPHVGGSSNSIQLHVVGNFTPPGTIFVDGFESSR